MNWSIGTKEKSTYDNAVHTAFAPQLDLVTTSDRANLQNVATLVRIMSTSNDSELIRVSVSKARCAYECLTDESHRGRGKP